MAFADRRIKINGQITGIFYAFGAVGSMTFPWLCGQIYDAHGPRMMLLAMFFALLAAAGIYMVVRVSSGGEHESN
jgi:nitrate/nitrite transporter NarK